MTEPTPNGPRPDADVDATVQSAAALAKEAGRPDGGPADGRSRPASRARRHPARAWALAVLADAVQWVFMPLFAPGFASPANDALEVVVCALLIRWCGWHWAFLPTLVAELVPGVDLVPTWTLAVWIATRRDARGGETPAAS